jgi:hypothetical protein
VLSRREHQAWFQGNDQDTNNRTDEERKFFEAIKNPPAPAEELKDMVREFGFVVRKE